MIVYCGMCGKKIDVPPYADPEMGYLCDECRRKVQRDLEEDWEDYQRLRMVVKYPVSYFEEEE